MKHIPGVLNPSDDMTKPLGWILHARHCRRIMGHYGWTTFCKYYSSIPGCVVF